ncbi:RidA family protein [Terrarubrum flagellatum]|uniref:RidA family protein n=1 Tax=Terrirubrum flagellatum TaxID=2895980 RepID=UPI00314544B0
MNRALTPAEMRPPFANYSHGIEVAVGSRMVFVSGQLGVAPDGSVPDDVGAQADQCFANIATILGAAGLSLKDIVRISGFVTDRADMAAYMAARDRHVGSPPPASTLMIVSGFNRPEFKVEIEVVAAKKDDV